MRVIIHEFLRTVTFITMLLLSFGALAGVGKVCEKVIDTATIPALLIVLGCLTTFFIARITSFLTRPSHNKFYSLR